MHPLKLPPIDTPQTRINGKTYIFDPLRKKNVRLTPEEWVRQHLIHYLIHHLGYPPALMKIEASTRIPATTYTQRSDVLVFDPKKGNPLMIIECKAAHKKLTPNVLTQITRYHTLLHAPFLLVTNGMECFCYQIEIQTKKYKILDNIPYFKALYS